MRESLRVPVVDNNSFASSQDPAADRAGAASPSTARGTGPLGQLFDRTLAVLKWPLGVASLLTLPLIATAYGTLPALAWDHPVRSLFLLLGVATYALFARWHQRFPLLGSFGATLEHEVTHALFAWATFHRVEGLRATWFRGGSIRYSGPGNWLITVAPYFFPTSCLAAAVLGLLTPSLFQPLASWLMGVAAAFHVVTTVRETHRAQPDLKSAGWSFCLLFLPGANLLALGLTLAYALAGLSGMASFAWAALSWFREAA